MKVLYIFPHPDDESFGPGPAIAQQRSEGHDVYLLTLTQGGATKQRFKFNYSIEKMGAVRVAEMQEVAQTLDLSGMTILDLPDSGLKEMDPREIEREIRKEIKRCDPDVLVTYAVHGVSGFHDHLVTHAVVKRVFCEMRDNEPDMRVKRLAFYTIGETKAGGFTLEASPKELIDCVMNCSEDAFQKGLDALDCYKSYTEVIERSAVKEKLTPHVCFEFFQESYENPVTSIFADL